MNKISYPIFGARALSLLSSSPKTNQPFPLSKESINPFITITTIILKRKKYAILSKIRQQNILKILNIYWYKEKNCYIKSKMFFILRKIRMTKIAVIGVMESVGREILSFLEEDGIKAKDVFAVDYKSALGNQVSYGEDDDLDVYNLDDFDFGKVDVAIFATTDELAKRYVPKALNKGIKVVDTSSAFFAESDVPMIVAGVNDAKISEAKRGLVSIPSAAVTQMLLPLSKVHEKYLINRLVVTSYSSTSVYGKEGMDELFNQVRKIYMNDSLVDDQQVFNKQIAFNVIPQVGEFLGDETQTEWALNAETKKVLNGNVKVHANCAVIPAFIGCGLFVNVECADEVDVEDVRSLMSKTEGVVVFDKHVNGGYVTMSDVQGENEVYVSRLRQDISVENGISFWCVADNLRVGVAKNAFNVMKLMLGK